MPTTINRHELEILLEAGTLLVEVLPPAEFTEEHLAGAINLPVRDLTADTVHRLDRGRPVAVYCWDTL